MLQWAFFPNLWANNPQIREDYWRACLPPILLSTSIDMFLVLTSFFQTMHTLLSTSMDMFYWWQPGESECP
jgi:hypothetical protein